MFICICNRLTDSQVTEAICNGAASPEAIHDACGSRAQCGCCAVTMDRYLDAAADASATLARKPVLAEV